MFNFPELTSSVKFHPLGCKSLLQKPNCIVAYDINLATTTQPASSPKATNFKPSLRVQRN